MSANLISQLQFQSPFRKYQADILEVINKRPPTDHKYHIVAPPGAGKTVVGIELLRRLGHKAVVFAPNSTIQQQWVKQVKDFLKPEDKELDLVSMDPNHLKEINIFTYQLISTQEQNSDFIDAAAMDLWQKTLIENRIESETEQALARIHKLKTENHEAFKQEMILFRSKAKDIMLTEDPAKVEMWLHPNAKNLIDSLVRDGIKTIVLDEVHHLLDYWAITIRLLTAKLADYYLIGLTATPPVSASNKEKAAYLSLMEDIDYEIPTPAVVKEGNLAPYQDLLYICQPTAKERDFIHNLQLHFDEFIVATTKNDLFIQFVHDQLKTHENKADWFASFEQDPDFAISLVRVVLALRMDLPHHMETISEMMEVPKLNDWLTVLKHFCLDFLKMDEAYKPLLETIKAALKNFGYVITESGVKEYRSPADTILAYSASKNEATVEILSHEMKTEADNLRAVVITDFEKMGTLTSKRLRQVLDPESGGAAGVFRSIVCSPLTTALEPILITGTTVMADAHTLPQIMTAMNTWRDVHGFNFSIKSIKTGYSDIAEVIGEGNDWKSSIYVRMVTDLFEQGITKCIVGTRGLIGEGWNSLRINTLIDLTNATSSTTTNQVRGRALRLDPAWKTKVANIWYVACVDDSFERGMSDFVRIAEKNRHFYGLNSKGEVVKGLAHFDETLAYHYELRNLKLDHFAINQKMLQKAVSRQETYSLWRIGASYQNMETVGLSLNAGKIRIKTTGSLSNSIHSISNALLTSAAGFGLWYGGNAYSLLQHPLLTQFGLGNIPFVIIIVGVIGLEINSGFHLRRAYYKITRQTTVDNYILDIGRAVIYALAKAELIAKKSMFCPLVIKNLDNGRIHVEVSDVSSMDSTIINQALRDVFSPVSTQRYLIQWSLINLPLGIFSPIWWIIYMILSWFKITKPTYHPVPEILAVNKKRVLLFANEWQRFVGGGKLIYTRFGKGSQQLLKVRQHNTDNFEGIQYEIWR